MCIPLSKFRMLPRQTRQGMPEKTRNDKLVQKHKSEITLSLFLELRMRSLGVFAGLVATYPADIQAPRLQGDFNMPRKPRPGAKLAELTALVKKIISETEAFIDNGGSKMDDSAPIEITAKIKSGEYGPDEIKFFLDRLGLYICSLRENVDKRLAVLDMIMGACGHIQEEYIAHLGALTISEEYGETFLATKIQFDPELLIDDEAKLHTKYTLKIPNKEAICADLKAGKTIPGVRTFPVFGVRFDVIKKGK